jgi:hypothetical protein
MGCDVGYPRLQRLHLDVSRLRTAQGEHRAEEVNINRGTKEATLRYGYLRASNDPHRHELMEEFGRTALDSRDHSLLAYSN